MPQNLLEAPRRRFSVIRGAVPMLFAVVALALVFNGLRIVRHDGIVKSALESNRACDKELQVSTPPDAADPVCRIESGVIARTYTTEVARSTGIVTYDHLVFAPPGGATTDFELHHENGSTLFDDAERRPNAPAAVLFIDGQPDYVATASGMIGPMLDPDDDAIGGWFFTGLGAFFVLMALLMGFLGRRSRA